MASGVAISFMLSRLLFEKAFSFGVIALVAWIFEFVADGLQVDLPHRDTEF